MSAHQPPSVTTEPPSVTLQPPSASACPNVTRNQSLPPAHTRLAATAPGGQKQHLGAEDHLPRAHLFLRQLGTGDADNSLLNTQTSAYPRKHQPAHVLSLCPPPPPLFGSIRPCPRCPSGADLWASAAGGGREVLEWRYTIGGGEVFPPPLERPIVGKNEICHWENVTPPPPSVGGQDRHRSAAMRHGGAGQHVGQTVSGAPRSTGARQPVCRPAGGGGALEPGLHSASAVIRRGGGAQPPTAAPSPAGADGGAHSPRSGQGRSSEDPTWDGGPGPSVAPRYAGGAGGVRALYICIQLYIDELSPANPLIPTIALASRT